MNQVVSITEGIGGADTITGDAGNDSIIGGAAGDELHGNDGTDVILGDSGQLDFTNGDLRTITSTATAVGGNDTITGDADNDIIVAGAANDTVHGNTGNDLVFGDEATISLIGGVLQHAKSINVANGGDDVLFGDENDDMLIGGAGADNLDGGDGRNVLAGDNAQLTWVGGDLQSITTIGSGIGAGNTIVGGAGVDLIIGGAAGDVIHGNGGDDVIIGDEGTITEINGVLQTVMTTAPGTGGSDVITGDDGNDTIFGGAAGDSIQGNAGLDLIFGDNGRVDYALVAGAAADVATTTDPTIGGNDSISGGDGNDTIFGGTANDSITGDAGNDLIFGDHGRVDFNAPANVNFTSIDITAASGGGNDTIFGNDGDDTILGQQGDDSLFGGAGEDDIIGGHNVLFGADGNDYIDGGSEADVVLGDNGTITRRFAAGGGWQKYVAPFGDTIRDVQRFDDVDLVAGNDTILGGDGADILHGQRGNDSLSGGAGDDELYGELGNDVISGGDGNDIALGDVGVISRAYQANGAAVVNPNGSWHKDVLLTDVVSVTGSYMMTNIDGSVAMADDLSSADMLILAGAYNADGSYQLLPQTPPPFWWLPAAPPAWETWVIKVSVVADGNDSITGDAGDDALYGQRGNDSLDGGTGNDEVVGGTGNDVVVGGDGNDTVVGDDETVVVTPEGARPNVLNGMHVIHTATSSETAAGVSLDFFGNVVVPMLNNNPVNGTRALVGLTPFATGGVSSMPAVNALRGTDGASLVPFASVIPQLFNHLQYVDGNDIVSGGAGDDFVVGDSNTVFTARFTATAAMLDKADKLAADAFEVADEWGDLAHSIDHIVDNDWNHDGIADSDWWKDHDWWKPGNTIVVDHTYTIGQDTIDGGAGNDVIVGDDAAVVAPVITVAVGDVEDLEHLVHAYERVDDEFAQASFGWSDVQHDEREVVRMVQGHAYVDYHTDKILLGNDSITGGDGNDMVGGDAWSYLAPTVTVVPGGIADPHHDHHDDMRWNWTEHAWADGDDWDADDKTWHDHQDDDKWNWDDHSHWHDHWHHDGPGDLVMQGNDTIDGGTGDDLVIADDTVVAAPVVTYSGVSAADVKALADEPAEVAWALSDAGEHHDEHFWHDAHDFSNNLLDDDRVQGGNDTVTAGDGNDVVFGLDGRDTLRGGNGNDTLVGGDDPDVLDGGTGVNKLANGNEDSSTTRAAVTGRLIDWTAQFSGYGNVTFPRPTLPGFVLDLDAVKDADATDILRIEVGPPRPKHA